MKTSTKSLSKVKILALITAVSASSALAHPHVWVTVKDTVVIEKEQIQGVQHEWKFDDIYTAMAIDGLDKNKDGKYSRDELQELAQTNIDGLKDFENFTYAEVSGNKVLFGSPRDYWLEHSNDTLKLHFYLPLASPLPLTTPNLKVTVADPSFFIGFELDKTDPVTLSASSPQNCKAALVQEQESADQKNLNQAFGAQMSPMGGSGSNTFEVTCGK